MTSNCTRSRGHIAQKTGSFRSSIPTHGWWCNPSKTIDSLNHHFKFASPISRYKPCQGLQFPGWTPDSAMGDDVHQLETPPMDAGSGHATRDVWGQSVTEQVLQVYLRQYFCFLHFKTHDVNGDSAATTHGFLSTLSLCFPGSDRGWRG